MNQALEALDTKEFGGDGTPLKIWNAALPFTDNQPSMKWDGEWHITIEVFRDLGLAFGAVCILIYVADGRLVSLVPDAPIVMAAIPFSLVGILPAHGLLHAFFTATSMIGFMAGGGHRRPQLDHSGGLHRTAPRRRHAPGRSGGGRRRRPLPPMLLTALAVVVGASVILADPIFQGLAISLMAGEIASLVISRMAVPVLYFMAWNRGSRQENDLCPRPRFGNKRLTT